MWNGNGMQESRKSVFSLNPVFFPTLYTKKDIEVDAGGEFEWVDAKQSVK